MADPTTEFFTALAQRGHERLLEGMDGSMRFDLAHGGQWEHWHVEISHGDVRVSREARGADCVLRMDRALFDRLATGRATAQAAFLRNQYTAEGDLTMMRRFDRIFPGPPGAHDPRDAVRRSVGHDA